MNTQKKEEKIVPTSSVTLPNRQEKTTNPKQIINNAFKTKAEEIKQEELENTQRQQLEELRKLEMKEKAQLKKQVEKKEEKKVLPTITKVQEKIVYKKEIKKMKRSAKFTLFIIFPLILITIISLVFYQSNINNPCKVLERNITNIGNELLDIINIPKESTKVGESFSITSTVNYKLEIDKDNDKKNLTNLVNNLNASKTQITIKQDVNDKKFFLELNTKKGEKELIEDKYLIDNSTEYYYIKGFLDKYINNGNNNYFESISNSNNFNTNLKYIYNYSLNNITNLISEEDFEITKSKTYLGEKLEDVKKYQIEIDDDKLNSILNNLIDKYREDKKSFHILSSLIEDFDNFKIKNNKLLNDKITLNIYTKGLFQSIKKIELITNKNTNTYIYDVKTKTLTILEKNNIKYYLEFSKKNNYLKIKVKDSNKNNLGSIEIDNKETTRYFGFKFDDKTNKFQLIINKKQQDIKKTSYKEITNIDLQIEENNKNILSGKLKVSTNISNKVSINEKINDVEFASAITKEQKDTLKELLKNRLNKKIE